MNFNALASAPVGATIGRLFGTSTHHAYVNDGLMPYAGLNLYAHLCSHLRASLAAPMLAHLGSVDLAALADGGYRLQLRVAPLSAADARKFCATIAAPAQKLVADVLNVPLDQIDVVVRQECSSTATPVTELLTALHRATLRRKPRVKVRLDGSGDSRGVSMGSRPWIHTDDVEQPDCDLLTWQTSKAECSEGDNLAGWAATLGEVEVVCIPSALELALAGQRELEGLEELATHPATLGRTLLIGPPDPAIATAILDLDALRRRQTLLSAGLSAPPVHSLFMFPKTVAPTTPLFFMGQTIQCASSPDLLFRVQAFERGLYCLCPPNPCRSPTWMPQDVVERRFLADSDGFFDSQEDVFIQAEMDAIWPRARVEEQGPYDD